MNMIASNTVEGPGEAVPADPSVTRLDAALELMAETQCFAASRYRAGMVVQHRVLHARNPAELAHAQLAFWQEALRDYTVQARRVSGFAARLWFPYSAGASSLR